MAKHYIDLDLAIEEFQPDVVMVLRIQLERMASAYFPSEREYAKLFGLNLEREARLKPEAVVLHPGPMNRGLEIAPEVADGPRSKILEQVANGVSVRMAVLFHLMSTNEEVQNA
jgi:aspartate carbamoyltransferase catalytic subunit